MENTLNAVDALKIAIKQEQDGYEYYTKVSKKVKDDELKKVIVELANDELQHEKIFNDLLKETKDSSQNTVDFDSSVADFLTQFVDTVFERKSEDIKKTIKKMRSDMDIIEHAINNEKDTLIFFMELKNASIDKKSSAIFSSIISEERSHVLSLSKLYSKLNKNALNKKMRK